MAKRNLAPPKSFEEALQELEQILAEIEGGEMGLEDSLSKYERGNFLIQHCRTVLTAAEQHIEKLTRSPDGGLQSEAMTPPPPPAAAAASDDEDDQSTPG